MKFSVLRAVNGLAVVMLLLTVNASAQSAKRLILTDGSYQTATEWNKVGDRVKYFSAERAEWEELPVSLVDWKATDAWNEEHAKIQAEELKKTAEEEDAVRKAEESKTPLVAPELRLPAEGGVFLMTEVAGKTVLSKLEMNKIQVNDNAAKNMLRRTINPIASQQQTIELEGAAAKIRIHSPNPAIFVYVEDNQGAVSGDYFRIVRLERKKSVRLLAKNKTSLTGDQSQAEKSLHSRAERFSGDWWKIIPLENLTPGEYAIVMQIGQDENAAAWGFGVDK
ncbi:MAG: hypothetical protein CXZ00_14730 [Acidobacteria bacterium]|nr:MAG: hypothetical protein CXZ00_14730 [Acidobacteriota bacterium]